MELEDALVNARIVPEMGNGFLMKTVDVLGDRLVDVAGVLERGEGVVGGIRLSVSDGWIAKVCTKPAKWRWLLREVCDCTAYAPVTLSGLAERTSMTL